MESGLLSFVLYYAGNIKHLKTCYHWYADVKRTELNISDTQHVQAARFPTVYYDN